MARDGALRIFGRAVRGAAGAARDALRHRSRHRALFRTLRGRMARYFGRDQRPRARARRRDRSIPLHMDHQRARHLSPDLQQRCHPAELVQRGRQPHPPREISRRARLIERELRLRLEYRTCVRLLGGQAGRPRAAAGDSGPHVDPGRGHARSEERRHAPGLQHHRQGPDQEFHVHARGHRRSCAARSDHSTRSWSRAGRPDRQPGAAHVVRADAWVRTRSGRALARRQARVRDADPIS